MEDFLRALIVFLSSHDVMPEEVQPTDVDREKTYILNIPTEPDNVFVVMQYRSDLPSTFNKEFAVRRIQIICRNLSEGNALSNMEAIYNFLKDRPEPIEEMNDTYWAMFDIQTGPVRLSPDERGRYLYSLSFPIKTKS